VPLAAQEFRPPELRDGETGGTRIGLAGFGVRSGVDFRGGGQLVLGAALDIGQIGTARLRLRPSGEISVFNGPNRYVGSFEALFRFTGESSPAVPYAGAGFSVAGRDDCGSAADCPDLWVNLVLGFELRFHPAFNWLLEYHGMDAMQRHRIYIGLTTRRGEGG
jgi:hypothetical protein